jgi:hypothetical protein
VDFVTFDETNKKNIIAINSNVGSDVETIDLSTAVKAEGNIEEWLCRLEMEMKRSMRGICARGARDCFSLPLREFIDSCPS